MPPIRSITKTPSGLVIATNTPPGTITVNSVQIQLPDGWRQSS